MYSARLNACGLAAVAALLLVSPKPALCGISSPAPRAVLEAVAKQPEQGPMTFRYRLSRPMMVSLTVRDPNGWVVKTLVDESVAAGEHAVDWDGSNLQGRAARGRAFLVELRVGGRMMRQIFVLDRSYEERKMAAL